VIGAAVVAVHFYRHLEQEVRREIQARIAGHYTDLRVTVRGADIVEGEGIRVRGLSIIEPGAEGPHAELLHVDEMMLVCDTDLQQLLSGELVVERVYTQRPVLRVTRRPDGTYSAAKLLPLPRLSSHAPEVRIEGGTIEVFDPLRNPTSTLTLRDVNLAMRPAAAAATPPREGRGDTGPEDVHRQGDARHVEGTLSGDHFQQMAIEGVVNPHAASWNLGGVIEGLIVSPALFDALPSPISRRLERMGQVRGQATLNFQLGYEPTTDPEPRFALSGELRHGRVDDVRLPHALTDLHAAFRLSNDGFAIDRLRGRWGEATVEMSCRHRGFDANGEMVLDAQLRQLELSRDLLDILPESLQHHWYTYRPSGRIDADVNLRFDGRRWLPRVAVRCLDVSFSHAKFPYRLDHGSGTVDLDDRRLRVSLTAYSGNDPLRLLAEVKDPLGEPYGWFQVQGDRIALDEKLLAALPDRSGEVVRALAPRGSIAAEYRLWREAPDAPPRKQLFIDVQGCSVRYEKFPYPIAGINGRIEMRDGHWTLRNLEGYNDTGRVVCQGQLRPIPGGGGELTLALQAWNVPLDEELRDALKPGQQRLWNEVRPRGLVDLTAEVHFLTPENQLSISTHIWPQPETASIEPIRFPYRLEKLRGELVFRDDKLSFDRLKAEHGSVRLGAVGDCRLLDDGRWQLRLGDLSIDRLRFDRELTHALPGQLRKVVSRLNPSGPFHLRGTLDLTGGAVASDQIAARWDLRIGCQQGTLDCGIKLENIHGTVSLAGEFDGTRAHSQGELDVDSLTYRDFQFTQIMGPVWIDQQRVLLGSWVEQRRGKREPRPRPAGSGANPGESSAAFARSLSAKLFDGTVYGDAWIALGPVPRWGLRATLNRADLGRCAQEAIAGQQHLDGKVDAVVDLRGAGDSRNAMVGNGAIQLHEADVYELPLMIALLKILSVRQPDLNAFSRGEILFRIEGEHVYFDQMDFRGDAISLLGKGEMDFQKNIRLTFHAIVGRGDLDVPVIKEIVGGASSQIMLIHARGTLADPVVRREAFPAVNKALQQLQTDLNNEPPRDSWWPEARLPIRKPWFGLGR